MKNTHRSKIKYCLILLLYLPIKSFSQYSGCLTDSINKNNNRNLFKSKQFANEVAKYQNSKNVTSALIKTIPVVIHIIHQNGPENISDAQVISQIDVLNTDFRRFNSDTANTNPVFLGVTADMEISFCLATIDPTGNPTNGIVRVLSSINTPSQLINLFGWDNKKYLNIYVSANVGAFSSFPWSPDSLDGIFVTHGRFGTIGTAGTELFAEFSKFGRTTTHEVGHYLGLYHTFDAACGTTVAGDSVSDTPMADMRWVMSTCLGQSLNTCIDIPDLPDQVDNYMDYNIDSCMNMFSMGQKTRVIATLNTYRQILWSDSNLIETGCNSATSINNFYRPNELFVFPNPAKDKLNLKWNGANDISVVIYNLIGQELSSIFITKQNATIDIANLPGGLYFLKITDENKIGIKKIIVDRN